MLNIDDVLEKIFRGLEKFNVFLLWIAMLGGCIVIWYFVISLLLNR